MCRWHATTALVLCIAMTSHAVEGRQSTPEFRTIDGVLLSAEFQGESLLFFLDSGTSHSSVDVRLAAAGGGVLEGPIAVSGFGPTARTAGILTKDLQIRFPYAGGAIEHGIRRVDDYARMSSLMGRDVHGILGADFFRRFVVEVDYVGERVRLHPRNFTPPSDGMRLSMRLTVAQLPTTEVRVHLADGTIAKARTMLDTGARGVLATEEFSKKYRLRDVLQGQEWLLGEGVGGKVFGQLVRLPVLEFGAVRLTEAVLSLPGPNSGQVARSREFDLIVGSPVLRRFSVFFDYRRLRVTLVPNARVGDSFDGTMSGLFLATLGSPHDRVVVDGVVAGSPAAEAGFEPGDEILEVDGEALAPLALVDLSLRLRKPAGTEFTITARRQNMRGVLTLVLRRIVEP